jgi:hypothetical protein
MPHRGFQVTSVYSISEAARRIIILLYRNFPPAFPRYFKDTAQRGRNQEIRERFAADESVLLLALAFGISEQQVHQIVKGKRK